MQQYNPPKSGKIAFQYGLVIGVILAVVNGTIFYFNNTVNTGNVALSWLVVGLSFLLSLAAYFISGILASQKTAKVSTGTFAGMWTGTFYGVIIFIINMILFFSLTLPGLMRVSGASRIEALRVVVIGGAVLGIALAIGLGAGLGSLGGLIGRRTSKVPRQDQPFYSGQPYPYPGQPYFPPPQQGYPDQPYPQQPQQPGDYPDQLYPQQPQQPFPYQPQSPGSENPYR